MIELIDYKLQVVAVHLLSLWPGRVPLVIATVFYSKLQCDANATARNAFLFTVSFTTKYCQ